jgi:hypothetical protein
MFFWNFGIKVTKFNLIYILIFLGFTNAKFLNKQKVGFLFCHTDFVKKKKNSKIDSFKF